MPGGAPSDQLSRTHRPPVSQARTTSRCGPGRQSSGYRTSLRRRATAMAAPSSSAARGCGRPSRRSGATSVASQHSASPGAVKNKIQAAPVLRTDAWRRSVGQPLVKDNPALGPQTFTRDAGPRLFKQGGAAGQQSAARARCRMVAQDIERGAAPREPIASAIPVREGQREAQAPAQGVHVRRGQRGARVSRHSRKPSPRMRARLRAETSAVARPHVWQKLGLAKIAVECARREKLPTMRPIAWFTVIRYSGRGRARKDVLPGRTLQWRTAASRRQGAAASSYWARVPAVAGLIYTGPDSQLCDPWRQTRNQKPGQSQNHKKERTPQNQKQGDGQPAGRAS